MLRGRASVALTPSATGKMHWIIEAAEPVGWITLEITVRWQGNARIGYAISEQARGHRYASNAVAMLAELAFNPAVLAVERLEAVPAVDNWASRRTLERSGFRFEGVLRGLLRIAGERVDHAVYGLLRNDLGGSA